MKQSYLWANGIADHSNFILNTTETEAKRRNYLNQARRTDILNIIDTPIGSFISRSNFISKYVISVALCLISYFTPQAQSLQWHNYVADETVFDIVMDGDNIWVASFGGVMKFNKLTGTHINSLMTVFCQTLISGMYLFKVVKKDGSILYSRFIVSKL